MWFLYEYLKEWELISVMWLCRCRAVGMRWSGVCVCVLLALHDRMPQH